MKTWRLTKFGLDGLAFEDADTPAPGPGQVLVRNVGLGALEAHVVSALRAPARFAVTVSEDKTARVWDVESGVPQAVLRVPIDDGAEGRLQAVVMSPDGGVVAVAGNTGRTWDGSDWIYVFDRASGSLLRRIDTRASSSVVSMALSADGRLLAVGLGGQGGLRVFDFATGALLGQDSNYADSIYALDFSRDGQRIVSGGADGRLHVYDVDAGRLKRLGGGRPEGGRLISQARFSPDGQLIAIGFEDSPQPQVLSAADLSVVARPAAGGAAPGAFSSLAWTPDGTELWGGGAHRDPGGSTWLLRVWPRANFASHADRPAAGASILALAALPKQRAVFVTAEPGWGTVDASAQVQRRAASPVANFNSLARQFQISSDGKRVRFWFGYRQPLYEFEFDARALREAETDTTAGWTGPKLEASRFQIEGWENRRGPTLNGRRLPLGELEMSRSLSIAGAGDSFVLGTDEGLWSIDAQGRTLWNRRTPALVWAVSHTADGRLLVTAGQDGVIRWYRARDGQELLALLPHVDKRRWVLWTPAGYFDAAVGAEDLLGWHINRRSDARPDFFPLRTLRARLHRPDVLDRLFESLDGEQAVRLANAAGNRPQEAPLVLADALPPVIDAVGAPDLKGSDAGVRVRVRLRSPQDAPVTALVARADGRPARVDGNGTASASGEVDLQVRFEGQPNSIALVAENKWGRSMPATFTLNWNAPRPTAAESPPASAVAVRPADAGTSPATVAAPSPPRPAATGAATDPDRKPRL